MLGYKARLRSMFNHLNATFTSGVINYSTFVSGEDKEVKEVKDVCIGLINSLTDVERLLSLTSLTSES